MKKTIFEISAVVATGLAKYIFVDVYPAKFWFILIAGFFWLGYIMVSVWSDTTNLQRWGFRKEGFKQSLKVLAIPSAIVIVSSIIYGIVSGKIIFNWHLIPILILYPIWGTLQQFMVISLFGGNLSRLENPTIPKMVIVLLTSILFSAVHYPSTLLMVATFFLAIVYILLFMKNRNLWILGLLHGWLGGLFYFFVLGRDPWLEIVNTI